MRASLVMASKFCREIHLSIGWSNSLWKTNITIVPLDITLTNLQSALSIRKEIKITAILPVMAAIANQMRLLP